MRRHTDQRRLAYCDLFSNTPGDVNLFILAPGAKTCWHRHQKQTDQFVVLRGQVRLQSFEERGIRQECAPMGAEMGTFTVPPNHWHGYENLSQTEPAWLLMYLDQKYDPSDEERLSEDLIPWDGRRTWVEQ